MAEADPETLLEWLSMGQGDERDMQVSNNHFYNNVARIACITPILFIRLPNLLLLSLFVFSCSVDCTGAAVYGTSHE